MSGSTSSEKSALIEKLVFAAIPIMFSCIVYLMSSLSNASNEIIVLKGKIAVVVNADNKAIPPQGTTIDMAQIREALNDKIDKVEKDAALARAAMTLEREKQFGMNQKITLEMQADAAQARGNIRAEIALTKAELDKRLSILEKEVKELLTRK